MARPPKGQAHLPVAPWRAVSFHMTAPLPSQALGLFQKKHLVCEPFFLLKVGSQAEGGEASLFSERFRLSEGQQTA